MGRQFGYEPSPTKVTSLSLSYTPIHTQYNKTLQNTQDTGTRKFLYKKKNRTQNTKMQENSITIKSRLQNTHTHLQTQQNYILKKRPNTKHSNIHTKMIKTKQ